MSTVTHIRPSFVVDVRHKLNDGRFTSALDDAATGVRAYPSYLGGYVMLMHAFSALGQQEEARVIYDEIKRRFGHDIPQDERVDFQLSSLNEVLNQSPNEVMNEPPNEVMNEPPNEVMNEPPTEVMNEPPTEVMNESPNEVMNEPPNLERREASQEVLHKASHEVGSSPLRIIDLSRQTDDERIIRSSSVRLIPGLEYTSLRYEGAKHRGRRSIQQLNDPPQFREFHPPRKSPFPNESVPQKKPSLEELAERIGKVKIKPNDVAGNETLTVIPTGQRISVVSETLARIYMTQGNYAKAIEAFTILQKQQPHQHEKFEALINECKSNL